MIHQPFGGGRGAATDIEIMAKEMMRTRDTLVGIISGHTGRTRDQVLKDIDRDNYMAADEAKEYGIIDAVITGRKDQKK